MRRETVSDGKRGSGKTTRAVARCVEVARAGGNVVYVAPSYHQAIWTCRTILKHQGPNVEVGDGRILFTSPESLGDRVVGQRVALMVADGADRMKIPEEALLSIDGDGLFMEIWDT